MIKQILFIIIATSAIECGRKGKKSQHEDPGLKKMQNRPLNDQEQSSILQQINATTDKKFLMSNTHYELLLDLKFQTKSVKDGFKKTGSKSIYQFTLTDENDKTCVFNFSVWATETGIVKNSQFKATMEKCYPVVEAAYEEPEQIQMEDDSSEGHDLNEGTWIPETLDNYPMNQDQTKLMLRILNLENFLTENQFEYKEGVYHTDVLLENENKKRNTFRLTLVKEDITCNFLIHDNENNKNTLSNDVKAQLRTCGVKNTKASFHQQLKNAIGKKFGNKVHDETSESSDDFERKSSSSEAEKEYPEIVNFLKELEDTYETKAVEVENNKELPDNQKPEFIKKLEDIMAQKLKNYENELIVKEDEVITGMENKIASIVIKQNEVEAKLDQKVDEDQPHKNPEFLKKLGEIYQKKAEEIQKDLDEEKNKRDNLDAVVQDYVKELLEKAVKDVETEKDKPLEPLLLTNNDEDLTTNYPIQKLMRRKNVYYQKDIPSEKNTLALIDLSSESDEHFNEEDFKPLTLTRQNAFRKPKNDSIADIIKSKKPFYIDFTKPNPKPVINVSVGDALRKHFFQNLVNVGQKQKCSSENIRTIKQLFTTLALTNKFQAVHLYDENFLECKKQVVSGMQYTAVMSFNNEKCVIILWHQAWLKDAPVKVVYEGAEEKGILATGQHDDFLVNGETLPNCADRIGTDEFIASLKN